MPKLPFEIRTPITSPHSSASLLFDGALATQLPLLRQRLLRHARLAVFDTSLAEDLVQDTLVAVLQGQTTHRGDASLTTWAIAILKHKIADWYRSPDRKRIVQFEIEADDAADATDADTDADAAAALARQQPENHAEHNQMMAALERCIACLPHLMGRVIVMRAWLGFETAEICERMQIRAANCRMILHRGRIALRQCMRRD